MTDVVNLLNHARMLGSAGKAPESLACFSKVLAVEPSNSEALHFSAVLIADTTDGLERALLLINRSLLATEDNAIFLTNKAIILQRLERFSEALVFLERALKLRKNYFPALLNYGHIHKSKKDYSAASSFYERAIAVLPSDMSPYEHLSFCYSYPENLSRRCVALERARLIDPKNADVGFGLGAYYLLSGRFAEGWDLFENRWHASHVRDDSRYSKFLDLAAPVFNAEEPAGPVFIWSEQGIGDEVMFSSLIPEFMVRFEVEVILQVDSRLEGIANRSLPGVKVISRGQVPSAGSYRTHLPSGDLPRLLRRSLESFSGGASRFLVADPLRVQTFRQTLFKVGKPIVGLSWYSSNGPTRCVPLAELAIAIRRFDVTVVNLQYGDHSAEIESVERSIGGQVFDFSRVDCRGDIEGLLALIECCDLVISIGNATVHFSGASGVPTLALLPYFPGWRWLSRGERSLWYRSVRLIRQKQVGSWDSAIEKVERELECRFQKI